MYVPPYLCMTTWCRPAKVTSSGLHAAPRAARNTIGDAHMSYMHELLITRGKYAHARSSVNQQQW